MASKDRPAVIRCPTCRGAGVVRYFKSPNGRAFDRYEECPRCAGMGFIERPPRPNPTCPFCGAQAPDPEKHAAHVKACEKKLRQGQTSMFGQQQLPGLDNPSRAGEGHLKGYQRSFPGQGFTQRGYPAYEYTPAEDDALREQYDAHVREQQRARLATLPRGKRRRRKPRGLFDNPSPFDQLAAQVAAEYEAKGYSPAEAEYIGRATAGKVAREKGNPAGDYDRLDIYQLRQLARDKGLSSEDFGYISNRVQLRHLIERFDRGEYTPKPPRVYQPPDPDKLAYYRQLRGNAVCPMCSDDEHKRRSCGYCIGTGEVSLKRLAAGPLERINPSADVGGMVLELGLTLAAIGVAAHLLTNRQSQPTAQDFQLAREGQFDQAFLASTIPQHDVGN
jgi:ssDNA-binding Zn-finger/Zn-ribbon topoisomerase 1